jgi:hypothetical protein
MKLFSRLGGTVAIHCRSPSEMLFVKTADINVKACKFKHSIKDDQIIRQKL